MRHAIGWSYCPCLGLSSRNPPDVPTGFDWLARGCMATLRGMEHSARSNDGYPLGADVAHAWDEAAPLWVATEGQVANLHVYLIALPLCFLVVPALWAIYRFALTSFHVYSLSDQRLLETTGLLSRQTQELELYRVKDISVEQPFVQRILGCGRVVLHTSDRSTPIVTLNAVSRPAAVARVIRSCVEQCRVSKGVREID